MKVIKIAFIAIVFVISLIAFISVVKKGHVSQANAPAQVTPRVLDRELVRRQYREWARQPHLRAAKI